MVSVLSERPSSRPSGTKEETGSGSEFLVSGNSQGEAGTTTFGDFIQGIIPCLAGNTDRPLSLCSFKLLLLHPLYADAGGGEILQQKRKKRQQEMKQGRQNRDSCPIRMMGTERVY